MRDARVLEVSGIPPSQVPINYPQLVVPVEYQVSRRNTLVGEDERMGGGEWVDEILGSVQYELSVQPCHQIPVRLERTFSVHGEP